MKKEMEKSSRGERKIEIQFPTLSEADDNYRNKIKEILFQIQYEKIEKFRKKGEE